MAVITRRAIVGTLALGACAPRLAGEPSGRILDFAPAVQARLPRQPPFAALFADGRRSLGVVAARHTSDPADPTFTAIRRAFEAVRPNLLIVEGVETVRGDNPSSVVDAARRAASSGAPYAEGERGSAAQAALAIGADVTGGEPTDAEVFQRLLQNGFDPADAFYAFLFGPLDQDARTGRISGPGDARFDAAFERWSRSIGRDLQPPPDTSARAFRAWYRVRFGVDINDDPEWLRSNDPGRPGPLQAAVMAHMRARDEHLFDVIVDRMASRERVVVVYGGSHIATLWPALKATFGRPTIL